MKRENKIKSTVNDLDNCEQKTRSLGTDKLGQQVKASSH